MAVKHIVLAAWASSLLSAAGCAGWQQHAKRNDVSQTREQRAAETIRDFEERRDAAQYEAALDRWRHGDAPAAERQLRGLVSRRPDFAAPRLRLAEILWSRGEASAEEHFRAVIAQNEASAEAHHGLGLMLDALGRRDEARRHLERAAQLQPANEAFQATVKSLP